MISLMLVDDHVLFRRGLCALIEQSDLLFVKAEAGSGEEAIDLFEAIHPDITLMDLNLPGIDGIQTMNAIHKTDADAKIIMLTATDFDDQLLNSIESGAAGYLVKNLEPEELFSTIETVHRCGFNISKVHLKQIVGTVSRRCGAENMVSTPELLSAREQEVIRLIAGGWTNREIADALVIAPNTVKAHISNIMSKLSLHTRVELAIYATSKGIADG